MKNKILKKLYRLSADRITAKRKYEEDYKLIKGNDQISEKNRAEQIKNLQERYLKAKSNNKFEYDELLRQLATEIDKPLIDDTTKLEQAIKQIELLNLTGDDLNPIIEEFKGDEPSLKALHNYFQKNGKSTRRIDSLMVSYFADKGNSFDTDKTVTEVIEDFINYKSNNDIENLYELSNLSQKLGIDTTEEHQNLYNTISENKTVNNTYTNANMI